MNILFITTGGTIDKDYPRCAGTYNFEISNPAIACILKDINPVFKYNIISILKKDSLDMTDNDRKLIYDVCDSSENDKIIITHGTDTIIKTAKKLSALKDKVIILTGASKPNKFRDSDAPFNIGVAIGAINIIKNGVYICMNGVVYNWNECKKDAYSGKFVSKSEWEIQHSSEVGGLHD